MFELWTTVRLILILLILGMELIHRLLLGLFIIGTVQVLNLIILTLRVHRYHLKQTLVG